MSWTAGNSLMDRLVKLVAYIRGYFWSLVRCDREAFVCKYGKVRLIKRNALVSIGARTVLWPDIKLSCVGGPGRVARLKIGRKCSIGDRTDIHFGQPIVLADRVITSCHSHILHRAYPSVSPHETPPPPLT